MSRNEADISQTDIKLGLALLDRKQTTVSYDAENKKLIIEIDLLDLLNNE